MVEISHITNIGFIITTIVTLWCFFKATQSPKTMLAILLWVFIVGLLGINGFYSNTKAFPPRFVFLIAPASIFILIAFLNRKSRIAIDQLGLKWFTLLHVVRVPVELVLYNVFQAGLIPESMTFEGYNLDILSGITAPFIYYFVFVKKWIGRKGLLIWNIACLALLFNILTIAILSAQTPFQQFSFDQPNIGVAYFPFVWLPAVIVPLVLFSHLVSIRQLIKTKNSPSEIA